MRIVKFVVLGLFIAVLSACNTSKPTPEPKPDPEPVIENIVSGKVANYTAGKARLMVYEDLGSLYGGVGAGISQGVLKEDGTFRFELDEMISDELVYSHPFELDCDFASSVDKTVAGLPVDTIYVVQGKRVIGYLVQASSKEMLETLMNEGTYQTGKGTFKVYVNKDVTLKGNCESKYYPSMTTHLALEKGWNTLTVAITDTKSERPISFSNATDDDRKLEWYFIEETRF
jgi:hypothetical protein